MLHKHRTTLTLGTPRLGAARTRAALAAGVLTLAAACGGPRDTSREAALQNDLTIARQAPGGQQVVSPQELTPGAPAAVAPATAPVVPVPAYTAPAPRTDTVTKVVYRDRPSHRTHHSAGSSSGSYSSGGGYASGEAVHAEPRVVRKNNTKRDAIIGGAAGAAIGAATSRDKLKGGLLGAVIGGALGGVVGNNVDVQHKREP